MSSPKLYFDLSHFGLIKISGEDATTFLQSQLTADINDLNNKTWISAAWCNPKGRILSNFMITRTTVDESSVYFMILPSMLKTQIMKRLQMFVLRSKVSIEDGSEDFHLVGLYGESIDSVYNQSSVITSIHFDEPITRVILLLDHEQLNVQMSRIKLACTESDRQHWSLLDIEGAIPWIITQTTEAFIPQMLNMDLNGGVSFKKGCFPGQEIVARLHYKGNEGKRRLYWVTGESDTLPGPGESLVNADDKLIGDIVDVEPVEGKTFKALVILDSEAAQMPVSLREQNAIALTVTPVPV